MKKVYISADIEGVCDIVSSISCLRTSPDFTYARTRFANEINAAARACFDFGCTDVTICEGHADMENIIIEQLDPRTRLISGAMRKSLQMEGIEMGYDAYVSFGHAGAGLNIDGVLNHCYNGKKIHNIRLNGQTINTETVINATIAGHYGIPLIAVIGDSAVCREVKEFVPNCEGIAVKEGLSRSCAISYHPQVCEKMIYDGVTAALKKAEEIKPLFLGDLITMEIDFKETGMADTAELVPGIERIAPRTIRYTGEAETVFKLQNLLIYRLVDNV
ncbi:MAG: M55 family metallopeptidase [Defluviitaleaceae bacterium]|nr:M55 family metallopeptidase [Defluviitaleaceae bacterium]